MSKSAKKILNTAEHLFNRDNFTMVGVDLIRDESGCSKTTLYTYFKNKQQLVIEVLKARDERFRLSLENYVGDAKGLEALNKIYAWHIEWFQQDHFKGCLFIRAAAEATQESQDIVSISKIHKLWLYEYMTFKLQDLKCPKAVVDLCYHFLESLISHFLVHGFDQATADQTKQLMNLLIDKLQN